MHSMESALSERRAMRKYLVASILCWTVAAILIAYIITGCAGGAVRPNCADDSIVAATIYHLRTGHKTYIQKSADGTHAQAFVIIGDRHVPLHVFPAFNWYVEPSSEDNLRGGKGDRYTVDEFIKGHGPWRIK